MTRSTTIRAGIAWRTDFDTNSATSMSACGPSGNRPNCAKLRAIASSRADSSVSTSTVSRNSSGALRRSRSTANRIGVSGFLSSCAKRRADSRNASARSASSARCRPAVSSRAIVRMLVLSTSNSGAPRRSVCSGMARSSRMIRVHPTNSSNGRLSWRLKCPATRDAPTATITTTSNAPTAISRIVRFATKSNRLANSTDCFNSVSCASSNRRCSTDSDEVRAALKADSPVRATRSHAEPADISESARLAVPVHSRLIAIVGMTANSSSVVNSRVRNGACIRMR